jgi:hypothetical protein
MKKIEGEIQVDIKPDRNRATLRTIDKQGNLEPLLADT